MRTGLLSELVSIGYEITLRGEQIRLRYRKPDSPPDRALPLIEELRNCKTEVIDMLRMKDTTTVSEIIKSEASVGAVWANPYKRGTPEARQASLIVVKEALA